MRKFLEASKCGKIFNISWFVKLSTCLNITHETCSHWYDISDKALHVQALLFSI